MIVLFLKQKRSKQDKSLVNISTVSGSTYCYAALKAKHMQCLSEFIYLFFMKLTVISQYGKSSLLNLFLVQLSKLHFLNCWLFILRQIHKLRIKLLFWITSLSEGHKCTVHVSTLLLISLALWGSQQKSGLIAHHNTLCH